MTLLRMSGVIEILASGAVGIAGTLLGVYLNNRLAKQREIEKKAVLDFFPEPVLQKFQCSVRIYLGVKHVEGELPVFNATGYLTIETEMNGRRSKEIPKEIVVKIDLFCLHSTLDQHSED